MYVHIYNYTNIIMLASNTFKIKYCSLILCIAQTWCEKLFVNKFYLYGPVKRRKIGRGNAIYCVSAKGCEMCKLKWKGYRDP